LNPSLNSQSFCRGKVPYLAGAFIPASGLARDREWRFWGDANDSERRWIQPVAVLHRTTTAERTVAYAQADYSVTAGVRQQRPPVTLGTRHVIGRPCHSFYFASAPATMFAFLRVLAYLRARKRQLAVSTATLYKDEREAPIAVVQCKVKGEPVRALGGVTHSKKVKHGVFWSLRWGCCRLSFPDPF